MPAIINLMDTSLPTTEPEIAAFIAAFEDGSLPKQRWTHGAHILGGAWYVVTLGEAAALDHMRERVSAYNLAVGGQNTAISGYHETITVFWITQLAALYTVLYREYTALDRITFVHAAVKHFAHQRDIYKHYWSYDVIASTEARAAYVSPDRLPIDLLLEPPEI